MWTEKWCSLMERVVVGECGLSRNGWSANAYYDILVESVQKDGAEFCEVYGARIELVPENGEPEVTELYGITPFRNVIERFVDRLCRNAVTPTTAGDVLEDYLAEL